ncbi:MAG: UDP-N-acetylmuramate dehydrogenase [Chitinophagaceae bacterium]|nr:UDP-N-acetylmuramate dehydrogenase [Chitinophagaceae bacterium]
MQFLENYSLRPHNSFGIDARARYFAAFTSVEQLAALAEFAFPGQKADPQLILGGGSNILLTKNIDGWVFHNLVKGIELELEDAESVIVRVGAGETWHNFVLYTIENNWAGIENLSLIPGSVGAAPMQNIGAYGVELKDSFHSLLAWHTRDKRLDLFTLRDCEFGYRESIFKKQAKGEYIIVQVNFRLNKKPVFHTSYGAIQQELEKMNVQELSIRAISDAVIRIRQSKLPDPKQIGNAGSFFKNPSVTVEQYESLKSDFPHLVAYNNPDGTMKLAAGWLIEQCGWKGYREGDAGCHQQQALVLVNYGNATGKEIYDLSQKILDSVKDKFGVELEREVNII